MCDNEVIVLYEGYSTKIDDGTMSANCSCTLIKTPEKNIIVDTMTAWDKDKIIAALALHNITPKDIHYVICSHSHADHIGNNNLFTEAVQHIVGTTVHQKNIFYEKNLKYSDYEICKGVLVRYTPGHTAEDISVIVDGKFNGENVKVGITGDLFEKREDVADPTIWITLGNSELNVQQADSRWQIANAVDVIIPGHGSYFKVTTDIKSKLFNQFDQLIVYQSMKRRDE
ncbi:unnamed protein product [Trichogramma brassicae]|uniref:Metallo-beta-lactamase domain-containing protein 1 n=1 Tax=Trichogramma brassicae TaxID=86971 RepID=A0A6H5IDE1_9HYME|nr:unnamed protein product [Trichogramma brassicae]